MKSLTYILLPLTVLLFSCNNAAPDASERPEKFVSRSMFREKWPLTIESGTLKCLDYGGVVLITEDGKIYGVNGTAKSYGRNAGYANIEDIWADDLKTKKQLMEAGVSEKNATSKINIGPLLDEGLKLCE